MDTLHNKIRDLSKINHKLEQENKELSLKLLEHLDKTEHIPKDIRELFNKSIELE